VDAAAALQFVLPQACRAVVVGKAGGGVGRVEGGDPAMFVGQGFQPRGLPADDLQECAASLIDFPGSE
jgi:hypothetical protein